MNPISLSRLNFSQMLPLIERISFKCVKLHYKCWPAASYNYKLIIIVEI